MSTKDIMAHNNNKALKFFLIAFVCFLVSNCSKTALPPHEFAQWVEHENNGLKVYKNIGDYEFTLQYKPVEYIALNQLKHKKLTSKVLDDKINELNELQYFTFQIALKDKNTSIIDAARGDPEMFEQLVNYFSFGMQNDIQLLEGDKLKDCVLFHFERSYGLTPYNRFVLAFANDLNNDNKSSEKDKIFLFNDHVLGVGPMKMKIQTHDLDKIPNIKVL
ncbi:MAG: hypothetical protein IIA45_04320 [Bacteroidetes bacterium]|nr:hypothetical protein [Bacteroidota bacterium]